MASECKLEPPCLDKPHTNVFSSIVKEESNVIIRNIGISKVLAENGDAIGVRKFSQLA